RYVEKAAAKIESRSGLFTHNVIVRTSFISKPYKFTNNHKQDNYSHPYFHAHIILLYNCFSAFE
ncbi:hypothetical protein, partial [Escherichia coli]